LAGQPNEPWQSYSPPPADNDTYAYPQSGGQPGAAGGGQAYARPAPGYSDEPFGGRPDLTRRDLPPVHGQPMHGQPGQPGQDQGFQGYAMPPGYPPPQDQAAQWQAAQDMQAPPRAVSHGKGFFGSLFDFSFTSFVTPKIIKVLYVLYTIWMVVWALFFLRLGFKYGGAAGGFATLIVVDPIFLVLSLGLYRVVLELFMVVYRIHEDLKAIRERDGERG
jgi:Domain of unknown function (DUF4282)